MARSLGRAPIDWDRPDWGGHVTVAESWNPSFAFEAPEVEAR